MAVGEQNDGGANATSVIRTPICVGSKEHSLFKEIVNNTTVIGEEVMPGDTPMNIKQVEGLLTLLPYHWVDYSLFRCPSAV